MDRKNKISPDSNTKLVKNGKSPRGLKRDAHGRNVGKKIQKQQDPVDPVDSAELVEPVAPVGPVEPVVLTVVPVEPVDPVDPVDPLGELPQELELPVKVLNNDLFNDATDHPDIQESFKVVDPLTFVSVPHSSPLQDIESSSVVEVHHFLCIPQVANGHEKRNGQQKKPKLSTSRGTTVQRRSTRNTK